MQNKAYEGLVGKRGVLRNAIMRMLNIKKIPKKKISNEDVYVFSEETNNTGFYIWYAFQDEKLKNYGLKRIDYLYNKMAKGNYTIIDKNNIEDYPLYKKYIASCDIYPLRFFKDKCIFDLWWEEIVNYPLGEENDKTSK